MKALPTLAKNAIEQAQDRTRIETPAPPAAVSSHAPTPPPDSTRRDLLIASAALVPGGVLWLGLQINPPWAGALLAGAGVLVMAGAIFRA
jgi:hypothetical protein